MGYVTFRAVVVGVAMTLAASLSKAQASRPCERLAGTARTQCLSNEVARTARDAERANARLAQLNLRMKQACDAMDAANTLASTASRTGAVTSAKPLLWGGKTWTSITSIMSYVGGTRRGCEEARSAVGSAR